MEIEVLETVSGDPCYVTKGHIDKAVFSKELYIRFDEEWEESDIRHVYRSHAQPERMKVLRGKPNPSSASEETFWFCGKDDLGAEPVTAAYPW